MASHLPVAWTVPKELKPEIRKHVGYLIKLCPGWVHRLSVEYSTDTKYGPECKATMTSDYKYRHAHLTIYPPWIWLDEEQKKAVIIHEAVHILVAPLHQLFADSVKALFADDEKMEQFIHNAWDVAHEATVEDLARAFIDSGGWGAVEIDEEGSTDEATEVKPFQAPT